MRHQGGSRRNDVCLGVTFAGPPDSVVRNLGRGAADEEFPYRGVLRLCQGLQADAAIVAEPTSLRLVIATKGCIRFRIIVWGKAAHSSKPHLGLNAISQMARVISMLEDDAASLASKAHPLLGPATFILERSGEAHK